MWWRKRQGLPILPGKVSVSHILVSTTNGPALVPGDTEAIPITLAQATTIMATAPSFRTAVTVKRDQLGEPLPDQGPQPLMKAMTTVMAQRVAGAFDPFDPYTTAPTSLRVDEYGVLRSSGVSSRPFGSR